MLRLSSLRTVECCSEDAAVYHQIEHSGLTPQDMVVAKDHLRKTLYTNHGTRNEHKTADADSAKLVEDDTFYTHDICTIEGTLYQIVGRVDRIQMNEDGTRTLVEIKNRTKMLFNRVRDYEEVQCQTYLQMLGDIGTVASWSSLMMRGRGTSSRRMMRSGGM
jgi:hypothetical protein